MAGTASFFGILRFQRKHHKDARWLVDRGFTIQNLADPLGIQVNMPAFLEGMSQMSPGGVYHSQQVASERIHIERAINKVKNLPHL